jgi:hypothetical protein
MLAPHELTDKLVKIKTLQGGGRVLAQRGKGGDYQTQRKCPFFSSRNVCSGSTAAIRDGQGSANSELLSVGRLLRQTGLSRKPANESSVASFAASHKPSLGPLRALTERELVAKVARQDAK